MELQKLQENENAKFAARLFLLVLLPFFLGMWVLPHSASVQGSPIAAPSGQQSSPSDMISFYFNNSAEGSAVPRGINSAFPFSEYLDFPPFISPENQKICFADNGSTLIYPNGTIASPDFNWTVHLEGGKSVTVGSSSINCTAITGSRIPKYGWSATINTNVDRQDVNGTVLFYPETSTYLVSDMNYGLLQGLVMIPVFFLVIWYPLFGIIKKLKHGMDAQ